MPAPQKTPDAPSHPVGTSAFSILLQKPAVTGATMACRSRFRDLFLPIPKEWTHDEWIALLIASVAPIHPIRESLMEYRRHAKNLVGIPGVTIGERQSRSLARPFSEYGARSEAFVQLRDRMTEKFPEASELLAQIDGKIRHFRTRADLPESRWSRVPQVLRELATGRYRRFSGTALTSLRDLAAVR